VSEPHDPAPGPSTDDAAAFARPPDVAGAFAPREEPPLYSPPPPTASPEERAVFGAPASGISYAPLAGERIGPHSSPPPPVPQVLTDAFGGFGRGERGFDPAPGSRIAPSGRPAESPWWKTDAPRDPWRDPASPFWLGSGAIFSHGAPAQLEPELDHELDDDDPVPPTLEPDEDAAAGKGGRRGRFGLSALVLAVVVAIVAGGLGGGAGYWLANRANNLLHRDNVSLAKTGKPANRPPGSVADIAKRVGPAVVSIAVTTSNAYSVGSGVVIDKNGYVLTNNHVVSDATKGTDASIVVTFSDEATAKAEIVGHDPISDLAVIKVPTDQLTVASLGDSDTLAVGDPVIAIGSPLGLEGTVTQGIVSALGRAVHVFSDDGSSDAYLNAVQTDAAINPGNSGGALVDASGAVVGINSAGRFSITDSSGQQTPVSGIGYAIPINYARDVAEQLIKSGRAQHGSLNAQGRSVTDGNREGAYLEQVAPGGAAAKAGLVNGDVIVVADGHAIISYDQLVVIVQQHKPGDKVAITYFHNAAKKTATITLAAA
jgi:S1-C subfamily serine protease